MACMEIETYSFDVHFCGVNLVSCEIRMEYQAKSVHFEPWTLGRGPANKCEVIFPLFFFKPPRCIDTNLKREWFLVFRSLLSCPDADGEGCGQW